MNKIYQKECESSCEYSLPDYLGDVKKILNVSASVIPSGKFVNDGEVNFSGVVSYDILYSDSEGKLSRITTSSDYDLSLPVDSDLYEDSFAEGRVANLSVRLTGPRKLTAKAVVSSNVKVSYNESLTCGGDAFADGNTPETVTCNISVEKTLFASSPEREYAEEAERLDGVSSDEIEVISASGQTRILEATPTENGVLVRGELIITCIIRTTEQPPFAIKKTVPFEETVNLDGLMPDMQVLADGYLSSVTAGVSDDVGGCVITVNAISELYCMASKNEDAALTKDAYLKNRETCGKYEDLEYSSIVCMKTEEGSFTASVSRGDIGCENIRDILTLGTDVRSFQKSITSGGFEISGDATVSGIACEINENGSIGYVPVKFTAPFKVFVSCNTSFPESAQLECSVTPVETEGVLDAEKLTVKCMLKIGYRVTSCDFIRRMTECSVVGDTEYKSCLSSITVYYPDEDESLFEIAKKFHTTGAKIASDNSLSEQTLAGKDLPVSLSGVKKLIIR